MTAKLHVQFGDPEHGWLSVQMEAGEQNLSFVASHTPFNSLIELITALANLISIPNAYSSARWNSEPIQYHFLFSANGVSAELKVVKLFDSRQFGGENPIVFNVQRTRTEIVTPIWRGLRNLESRWRDVDQAHW